jgi:hypothetical protein
MHPELSADPGLRAHEADEYYLGDSLLVAPILTPGGQREVWLPPGIWHDWWTHEAVGLPDAPTLLHVTMPMGQVPLYVKAGGLVPMLRPNIDTLAPFQDAPGTYGPGNATELWWLVLPGAPSSYTLESNGTLVVAQANTQAGMVSLAGSIGGAQIESWLPAKPAQVQCDRDLEPPDTIDLLQEDTCTYQAKGCWHFDPPTHRFVAHMPTLCHAIRVLKAP